MRSFVRWCTAAIIVFAAAPAAQAQYPDRPIHASTAIAASRMNTRGYIFLSSQSPM